MSIPLRGHFSRPVAMALAAVTVCAPALVNLALTVGRADAAPASIYCSTARESRQPVLLVHGFNSGPQTWQDASRKQLAAAGSSSCIDVFDYADASTNWVTDSRIGPALATRVGVLAAASKAGGGSGKVIIVAHSMGGLAIRCAASPKCNGGKDGVAPLIAELISFGTPNDGSWLVGPGLHDVGRTLGSLFSAACYLSFNGANPICEEIRALGTSDATRAFNPDSTQLRDLLQLPPDVPVYALAGQIEIHSSFFGLNDVDVGDGGDTIVLEDSAQAAARQIDGIGGSQTINCGKIDFTDLNRSAHSCWHGTETNDTRFLEAAAHQIALVEDKLNASGVSIGAQRAAVITCSSDASSEANSIPLGTFAPDATTVLPSGVTLPVGATVFGVKFQNGVANPPPSEYVVGPGGSSCTVGFGTDGGSSMTLSQSGQPGRTIDVTWSGGGAALSTAYGCSYIPAIIAINVENGYQPCSPVPTGIIARAIPTGEANGYAVAIYIPPGVNPDPGSPTDWPALTGIAMAAVPTLAIVSSTVDNQSPPQANGQSISCHPTALPTGVCLAALQLFLVGQSDSDVGQHMTDIRRAAALKDLDTFVVAPSP